LTHRRLFLVKSENESSLMRTPVLLKYESKLIEVNNQLCYFLFSNVEIEAHLAQMTEGATTEFTTDLFPGNKFSKNLHVKVNALPVFRERAFHTLMGICYIASVEYMLCYIDEIEKFRASVLPTEHDSIKDEKPEIQLGEKFKRWPGKPLEKALIKTITYLRLRRNNIVHLNEKMSPDYSNLVKNDSRFLNRYWKATKANIYDFDFSKTDFSTFTDNEALALISLTRICLKVIDKEILSTINNLDIAKYEIDCFLENKDLNRLVVARKTQKFMGVLKQKYGVSVEVTETEFCKLEKESKQKVLSGGYLP
jgi:hypothetical protein